MFNYREVDSSNLEYIRIASASDLPAGERLFIELDGIPLVLFNIADQLFAIKDICTHDNGPLGEGRLEGRHVICPRHGARFDLQTGKALRLPAVVDIPSYPVRIVENSIEIGIPRD